MRGIFNNPQVKDLELQQCHIRLGIPLPLLFAWFLFWALNGARAEAYVGMIGTAVFYAWALVHRAVVKCRPGRYPGRRLLTIAVDQAGCFVTMLLTAELGAIAAFLHLWISLGNGIRFGVKWMAFSSALACGGLVYLGVFSTYWSQHPIWIFSLVLLNVAIPAYVASLIRGYHESRAQLARYAGEMEEIALTDTLTGLPNRAAFFSQLQKAVSHAQRTQSSIALLYFDLDGFKQVNDSLGHAHGDSLLKETALRVGQCLRGEDVLARLGGDEFVVLLNAQDKEKRVEKVAARILQAVASIDQVDGHRVEITASAGIVLVSGAHAAALGSEGMIHEADKNMYAAKKKGKNQTVLSSFPAELRLVAGLDR